MDVMAQKYAEMKTNVANDYHNSAFTEKGLSFVNISENLQKSTGEINLLVETGTGQRGVDPGPPGPFVDGDDWYYGEYVGHCNPHTYDTDAAHQLMIAMNSDIPDPTGNYFFVNLTTKIKYGGASELRRDGDPDPINNNFDYYLYSTRTDINPFNSSTLCLSHIEMNYYFSFLQYLLYTKIPDEELMQGYAIQSVVGMIGYWEGIGTIDKHYLHKGTFQFGKKVYYASEEPEEL
jgi:hypothetical protein